MSKYWAIFKISWQNDLIYRFNFLMWRIRTIISFLGIYWFWLVVYSQSDFIGNYSRNSMLVYLFLASFLSTLVLSNASYTICAEIATGDLNNYLTRPVNYLYSWLTRDWTNKLLNLVFFAVEAVLLIFLLKLPIVWPISLWQGIWFIAAAFLAALMYFFFSFIFSSFSFWYPEHNGWPLRFFMLMLLEFLSGQMFPLDIFPPAMVTIFKALPFYYFIFYPTQIYFGRANLWELVIMIAWLVILIFLARKIWQKGLQIYGAYGR